jgi:nucleotide-binding universal stress UspA family protein
MRGIIVGFDGSPPAQRALEWAHEQARRRGGPLTAVHVYRSPSHHAPGQAPYPSLREGYAPAGAVVQTVERQRAWVDEAQRITRSQAEEMLARAIARFDIGPEGLPVGRFVIEGDPARELIELSEGADLLVVGHRGQGGFKGVRVGSVSLKCVQHAHSPVVVVR